MKDLVNMAAELTSMGLVVSVDVDAWNGTLPPRPEWGNYVIRLLPDSFYKAFREIEKKIARDLAARSIKCSDGLFIPERSIGRWMKDYDDCCKVFSIARSSVLSVCDGVRDGAKSVAAAKFNEAWAETHPLDSIAPPSGAIYASNLAASMIPKKDDLYDLYKIHRRVNTHSFCFAYENFKRGDTSIIGDGELRTMAWGVIDDLVAGNVRQFAARLNQASTLSYNFGKRVEMAICCSHRFVDTDLLPLLGLSGLAMEILSVADGKSVDKVDKGDFGSSLVKALELTRRLSTVDGILGAMQ